MKIDWPHGKRFAFTIIDDTDNATVSNVKPVYDLLLQLGMITTKTVWVYPSRDQFTGETLQDAHYLAWILELKQQGFEIGMHNVGSGSFTREEILAGLELFREKLGQYPHMHINHSRNPDNLFWGYKRFGFPLRQLQQLMKSRSYFEGEDPASKHFWGDAAKQHIRFIRNHVFNRLDLATVDTHSPYRVRSKEKYSNYWFSSSDGHTVDQFTALISKENVDRLAAQGGYSIVYTHFASGFVKEGKVHEEFRKNLEYLAAQGGWFVPAGTLLEFLRKQKTGDGPLSGFGQFRLDMAWLVERVQKRLRSGI